MKKIVVIAIFLSLSLSLMAQNSGIKFFKGSWEEALTVAKKEKKKIFIDFYTEWCGPCLSMAEGVFKQSDVGEVYNDNFINIKIDAEKGEGIELSKRYGVRSFPTYVFVNPKSQEMIHRSGGNKPSADFIADTKGALNKKLSSIYLDNKYKSGEYDTEFLKSYIEFKKSSGAKGAIPPLFDELISKGAKLTDREIWDMFVNCLDGYNNVYIKQISDNYSQFVNLFGKNEVDSKLSSATRYAPIEFVNSLCDFKDKKQNIALREISTLFNSDDYEKAFAKVDEVLSDKSFDIQAVLNALSFAVRINPRYGDDDLPLDIIVKKLKYLQLIAYNKYDRDDTRTHFDYASALEYVIMRSIQEGVIIPKVFLDKNVVGKEVYDMRHPELKQKPKRK